MKKPLNARPTAIPIDDENWAALRYLLGAKSGAARTIGKLLENRIMDARRPGQAMNENLAPARRLLAEVRALDDELQRGRPQSWRAHLEANPPSPEAIALLVIVSHERLSKQRSADNAKKGHAPTRDAMTLVHAWWFENGEGKMTKEAAADKIVDIKLVGEKRSAIRKWLYPGPLEAARVRLASASKR